MKDIQCTASAKPEQANPAAAKETGGVSAQPAQGQGSRVSPWSHRAWRHVAVHAAAGTPQEAPRAGVFVVRQFWEHFRLGELAHQAGVQLKHKGLPAVTLLFIALLFGLYHVNSTAALAQRAVQDPLLVEMCAVQTLERKQLYRLLGQVPDTTYSAWLGELLHALQRDPRTATARQGIVAGDDTKIFRTGKHMPYVTLIYSASGQRFGLGNVLVSTHYADAQKDYPLLFDFWRPSPAQIQAAQAKRDRKRLGVDQRKPADGVRWLEHQVQQHQAPDLVLLHGAQCGPVVVAACERLKLPWVGVASGRRQYTLVPPRGAARCGGQAPATAAELAQRDYTRRARDWQELSDLGCRALLLGESDVAGLGRVCLVLIEEHADQARTVLVLRPAEWSVLQPRLELALAQHADADPSRLQVMLTVLRRTRAAGVLAETAVFDRWFFVTGFIRQVLALGFARVILQTKRDQTYTYRGRAYAPEALGQQIPAQAFKRQQVNGRWVKLARRRVQHAELGHVQLVFVKELGRHNKIVRTFSLMCTDPGFRPQDVYRAYKWRWKIEEGYRELRQNHGLADYHARNFNENFGHVTLSFISYLCLLVTRLLATQLRDKTLGHVKRVLFDALITIEQVGEELVIRFNHQFWQHVGLPNYSSA